MVDNKKMELNLVRKVEKMPAGVHIPDPNIQSWDDMNWKDIREEYQELVPRVLREDERTAHYCGSSKTCTPDLRKSIEIDCVASLKESVDTLRARSPEGAKPVDCNWYELFSADLKTPIERRLKENELIKEKLGLAIDPEAFNIAMAVADGYRNVIYDRNEITIFSWENTEY